ncbi:hypothetical protein BGW38_009219, partial [Lunasporangiospora selenospora]
MANVNLILFCLVDGEATSNAFPVSASTTTTIGELKDLIKSKKSPRFDDVAADELTLWRTGVAITDDNDEHPISLDSLIETKKLGPATRLSRVFPDDLPEETVHIIVQRPPSDNLDAAIDKISEKFFAPAGSVAKFLDSFVRGVGCLPVTTGPIRGLPRAWRRSFRKPSERRP